MLVGAEFDSDPLSLTWLFPVFEQLVKSAFPFHSFPGLVFGLSA